MKINEKNISLDSFCMLNTSSTIPPNNYGQTHKFAAVSPASRWQGRSSCRNFRTPIKNWSLLSSAAIARERNDACWSIRSTKWNSSMFQRLVSCLSELLTGTYCDYRPPHICNHYRPETHTHPLRHELNLMRRVKMLKLSVLTCVFLSKIRKGISIDVSYHVKFLCCLEIKDVLCKPTIPLIFHVKL